jgi:FkbM family methyltransferase
MNSNLVYDVGLHKGEDSEFYLKKGFRVVAIEAVQELCEIARRRLHRYVETGQLVILNVAICNENGSVKFFANQHNSVWGTANEAWAKRNERMGTSSCEITVKGTCFSEVLAKYGMPYYLKIDIEGSDLLCVSCLKDFQSRPKHLSLESAKTSWRSLRKEFALLEELGYSRFKVVAQNEVVTQVAPNPAREGRYAEHQFEHGASGLFGEELPGRWLSRKEALKLYRRIFLGYRLYGDDGLLSRPYGEGGILQRSSIGRRVLRHIDPHVGWYDTHAAS